MPLWPLQRSLKPEKPRLTRPRFEAKMLEEFANIGKNAVEELKSVSDSASLEQFRIKYLGRKGQVTLMLTQIGKCPQDSWQIK